MQVIIILLLIVITSSCNTFSKGEKKILEQSILVINKSGELRDNKTNDLIKLLDIEILKEGDKDRDVFKRLDSSISTLKGIHIENLQSKQTKDLENLIFKNESNLSLSSIKFPKYFHALDSSLYASWKSQLKEDITMYYASRVSIGCCMCFTTIKPFIEVESKIIEQGQPYKAKFFLGVSQSISEIKGKDTFRNENGAWVINYLPDQSKKSGEWKGKAIYYRDTLDIKIPYEIKDCK